MFNPLYDKPGVVTGLLEFLLGFIFFPGVCFTVQTLLRCSDAGVRYCSKHKINNNGVHDISNKITSSVFAVCACSIGCFVNRQCVEDSSSMSDRFYVLDNYLIFGVSYFFYDVVSMYLVYNTLCKDKVTISSEEILQFLSDRPLIVFHHILVPLIGFPAMMYFRDGYGDCLLGSSFLIEASTPFVSLRVILVHLNMKVSNHALLISCLDCIICLGESPLHDQWPHDVVLLLHVQGHDLPHPLLVVRLSPRPRPGLHHPLHPHLGQHCHPHALDASTLLVQQDGQGLHQDLQGQTALQ